VLVRESLAASDRAAIESIVRRTGVFRPEEVAVALELVDIGLSGDDRGYRFVVVEDGAVVGYACFGHASMTEGVYDLYWIAVDPARQGEGIGRKLLARVEDAVRASGGRMLLVETESTEPYEATRRFYERAGYPELARVRDYYRPGADKVILGRVLGRST
jgi:ribosomal protein S18 acetylase RimI-like enzyme